MPRKPDLAAKEKAKVEGKQKLRKTSRTSAPIVVRIKRRRASKPRQSRPRSL
jgi:hypothetical protein